MKLTKKQIKQIIKEEKAKLDEMVGRRGPLPRQGLRPDDELILDEILELIINRVEGIDTPQRAKRQLRYYLSNMK
tara:strand:- start:523 stop:747 length:225 start_codon:yes stop_codon:yes gene_type:complete